MKKLVLGAAVAAALTATGAQAVPSINLATTDVVYLSGATAAEKFVEKLITDPAVPAASRICKPNTVSTPITKFQDTAGTEQYAYLCTKESNAVNLNLPASTKPNLLVYKRSAGGSAFGVSPIVADANGNVTAATIDFLKITGNGSCVDSAAVGGLNIVKCTYTKGTTAFAQPHIADFGISDVDPAQFTGDNAPLNTDTNAAYDNVTADDVGKLKVKSASALAFGVPVTKALYFTLQAAQMKTGVIPASAGCVAHPTTTPSETEACMPSLSSAQVASIHNGAWYDWNQVKVGTEGLYDWAVSGAAGTPHANFRPVNTAASVLGQSGLVSALHTCRRENGSGTQTQSNMKFLGNPCTAAAATAPAADAVVANFVEGDGVPMVHENSSSGLVDNCLIDLSIGTDAAAGFSNVYGKRWAVGIQSLEKKTQASTEYRFVKLDGVAPTLANVVNGKYRDWVENTFQYSLTHNFVQTTEGEIASDGPKLLALVNAIITSAAEPAVMSALNNGFTHTFTTAKGAYLAVPTNYPPAVNGAFDSTVPVNPYSHATPSSDVNNCRVPVIFNYSGVSDATL